LAQNPRPDWGARRTPTQSRARETVDVILQAAGEVFSKRGYAAGTTNRIAERAGVSVGTFYQYFPNKDAVLVALVERHVEAGMRSVEALLAEAAAAPEDLRALLRSFVTAMVTLHGHEPDLHRVLFEEAPHPPQLHECVLQTEEGLAHAWLSILQRVPGVSVRDPDTAAHLVVQLTEALTHRFVLHGLHELSTAAFIDEVVILLERYLMDGPE
jgi:AcrR family transcriptional regulator